MRKPRVSHLEVLGDKTDFCYCLVRGGVGALKAMGGGGVEGKDFKRICFAVKPFRKLNAMYKHL